MQAEGNAANMRVLTTTQRYENEEAITQMRTLIGVSVVARRKLVNDDFISMQILDTNYTNDVDLFISYLSKKAKKNFW